LQKFSEGIITDSGGIQEEAISLSKKVLVTRDKTERTEGMKNGLLKIISTDFDEIVLSVNNLLHSAESELKVDVNPFGSGEISKKIVDYLDSRLV
jgi:UDP-N-acetylglucosamine 2-epimerase (non-hydrolysing)